MKFFKREMLRYVEIEGTNLLIWFSIHPATTSYPGDVLYSDLGRSKCVEWPSDTVLNDLAWVVRQDPGVSLVPCLLLYLLNTGDKRKHTADFLARVQEYLKRLVKN